MVPAEPLTLVWTAANRVTFQGAEAPQDQRIPLYEALKAITIDAARRLNLEVEIRSLEAAKRANFTILGSNPIEVDPMQLKNIEILGIVYQGIFHKTGGALDE